MGGLQGCGVKSPRVHILVPGRIDQKTGGFIYDARMVQGLRAEGWTVNVQELEGQFPSSDACAFESLERALKAIPSGAEVVLDGLAIGAFPDVVTKHAERLRLVALVHHLLADETGLDIGARTRYLALERQALAACRGVIVTSRSTAARVEALGVAQGRIRAIPPGVDAAPRSIGLKSRNVPNLLCVGSIIPRKGQQVLVGALSRIRDRDWRCVCAGSLTRAPDYAEAVIRRIATLGLSSRFDLPGECDEDRIQTLYHSSTLFVLPSFFEGYGMVLAEALIRGLPVVTTTGGAISTTVPGDVGLRVPPGDEGALANAIGNLLDDRSKLRDLSEAAVAYAKAFPDWVAATRSFAEAVTVLTK